MSARRYFTESTKAGWIDHLGQFWGNAVGHHREAIAKGLGLDLMGVPTQNNWVMVFCPSDQKSDRIGQIFWKSALHRPINDAQASMLKTLGFDPTDNRRDRPADPDNPAKSLIVAFRDIYPQGYEGHTTAYGEPAALEPARRANPYDLLHGD